MALRRQLAAGGVRFDSTAAGFGPTGGGWPVSPRAREAGWGNGLVFQVLDLFNPFPPNAVDREYKPGSDMLTATAR
jgi:hypothetical protein